MPWAGRMSRTPGSAKAAAISLASASTNTRWRGYPDPSAVPDHEVVTGCTGLGQRGDVGQCGRALWDCHIEFHERAVSVPLELIEQGVAVRGRLEDER
jgi:hypothetical protein